MSLRRARSVFDAKVAAQVGVLLVALGFAFVAKSIRSAADIVDDQSLMLAWPWALVIACLSWMLATMFGPFETTRMLTILLGEWLPATVDGVPRTTLIGDLVPAGARWWAAFGPLPVIAAVWAFEVWRHGDSPRCASSSPRMTGHRPRGCRSRPRVIAPERPAAAFLRRPRYLRAAQRLALND
jgi:hypothetical protein